jgi:hypothetical protein
MRAKVRGVWLPVVGLVAAGVLAAVAVVVLTRSGDEIVEDDHHFSAGQPPTTEFDDRFLEFSARIDQDRQNSLLVTEELEANLGWAVLRPEMNDFRRIPFERRVSPFGQAITPSSSFTDDYLESDNIGFDRKIRFTQRPGQPVDVDARGAIQERIGGFEVTVTEWQATARVRGRFLTGASHEGVPIVAVVEAPDRETLVRFIESLSFGNRAAD